MTANRNDRVLFILSIICFFFFCCLYFLNYYKIDVVIIGVLRELLTIPALLAIPVLLFLSFRSLYRSHWKFQSYAAYSVGILLITLIGLIIA
jgi:hypothetical protein